MQDAAVTGLNHVTLAVSDMRRSIAFYRDVLGLRLRAEWPMGAYLEAGTLWLCLSRAERPMTARSDYTHIAFDVAARDFGALAARVRAHAPLWRENRSEGASLYFLDPDGHQLELHVGTLETRLAAYRDVPADGMVIHEAR